MIIDEHLSEMVDSKGPVDLVTFFDTGTGGVATAKYALEAGWLSHAYCVIDPEYAPYGGKDEIVIKSRTCNAMDFVFNGLESKGKRIFIPGKNKFFIIACNTASTVREQLIADGAIDPAKWRTMSVYNANYSGS